MQQNPGRPAGRRRAHRGRGVSVSRGRGVGRDHGLGRDRGGPGVLVYLLVLAAVVVGLLIALRGSRYTGVGTGLAGCALLVAALARLALPPHSAGLLASRSKALDVVAFTVLGGGVLGLALWLHNAF